MGVPHDMAGQIMRQPYSQKKLTVPQRICSSSADILHGLIGIAGAGLSHRGNSTCRNGGGSVVSGVSLELVRRSGKRCKAYPHVIENQCKHTIKYQQAKFKGASH